MEPTVGTEGPVRYFERDFQVEAVKILPGQYHAGTGGEAITTVLGSCIASCLWDPQARIGGMNHFMLPGDGPVAPVEPSARFGVHAMELLINRMVRLGADRRRLVAKVFGGARLLSGMALLDVGARNAQFVLQFLQEEGIPVAGQDLLDVHPRKVVFFPATGKAQVRRLSPQAQGALPAREREYLQQLVSRGGAGEVEIFAPPR